VGAVSAAFREVKVLKKEITDMKKIFRTRV
jgi:hypothetical protein